jgi:serine/threonine protein kinase
MKLLDFGLARILENADCKSNEVYSMSGETGSLRYMAPGKSILLVRAVMFSFTCYSKGHTNKILFVVLLSQRLLMGFPTITKRMYILLVLSCGS